MKKIALLSFLMFTICVSAQKKKLKNVYENNDKIGIGTKYPDHLLTVKGVIHTQEVIVDLDGAVAPDYVFDTYYLGKSSLKKDYHFITLLELEEFIKKNHHLPRVPSAKEIDKKGLALKEMNLLLLEKVEELTLYMLEQQKEIDALKERLLLIEK